MIPHCSWMTEWRLQGSPLPMPQMLDAQHPSSPRYGGRLRGSALLLPRVAWMPDPWCRHEIHTGHSRIDSVASLLSWHHPGSPNRSWGESKPLTRPLPPTSAAACPWDHRLDAFFLLSSRIAFNPLSRRLLQVPLLDPLFPSPRLLRLPLWRQGPSPSSPTASGRRRGASLHLPGPRRGGSCWREGSARPDRKSTRLNSSHPV